MPKIVVAACNATQYGRDINSGLSVVFLKRFLKNESYEGKYKWGRSLLTILPPPSKGDGLVWATYKLDPDAFFLERVGEIGNHENDLVEIKHHELASYAEEPIEKMAANLKYHFEHKKNSGLGIPVAVHMSYNCTGAAGVFTKVAKEAGLISYMDNEDAIEIIKKFMDLEKSLYEKIIVEEFKKLEKRLYNL